VLSDELECVRRDGFAVDREEFDEEFCCIAAPIRDDNGRFVAALGLSVTPHVFDVERADLAATVIDVAQAAAPAACQRAEGHERVGAGRLASVR
jgi:acetyl-CoA synthetase